MTLHNILNVIAANGNLTTASKYSIYHHETIALQQRSKVMRVLACHCDELSSSFLYFVYVLILIM